MKLGAAVAAVLVYAAVLMLSSAEASTQEAFVFCLGEQDCNAISKCRENKCVPDGPYTCINDVDCGIGKKCESDGCVEDDAPKDCAMDEDCKPGQKCILDLCTK